MQSTLLCRVSHSLPQGFSRTRDRKRSEVRANGLRFCCAAKMPTASGAREPQAYRDRSRRLLECAAGRSDSRPRSVIHSEKRGPSHAFIGSTYQLQSESFKDSPRCLVRDIDRRLDLGESQYGKGVVTHLRCNLRSQPSAPVLGEKPVEKLQLRRAEELAKSSEADDAPRSI